MREFIIVGRNAPTAPEFALDDLPGAGRLDLLARCVTASLLVSHGIRDDVRTHLVLGDAFTVRFDGDSLQGLNPDERSTAALIRTALERRDEAIGHVPVETSPGVSLVRMGLETTLDSLTGESTVSRLHEDGTPIAEVRPPEKAAFVLSDHTDLCPEDAAVVKGHTDLTVSLGPERLHADHAIAVAHNWLDTSGFDAY